MPLPNDKPEWKFSELEEAMKNLGWQKKLNVEWLDCDSRTGQLLKKTYLLDTANPKITCIVRSCPNDLNFLEMRSTGIMLSCGRHRCVQSISLEEYGTLLSVQELTFDEAEALLKKTNQMPPIAFKLMQIRLRPRIIK